MVITFGIWAWLEQKEHEAMETVRKKYKNWTITAAEFKTNFTWVVRISQQNKSAQVIVHANGNQIIGEPGCLC